MEWKVSLHRMNAFYISLLTMKSSIAFGTVYLGTDNGSGILYEYIVDAIAAVKSIL
jgi:hypothetical protein